MYSEGTKPGAENALYWALRRICAEMGITTMKEGRWRYEESELESYIISTIRIQEKEAKRMRKYMTQLLREKEELSQTEFFPQKQWEERD